MNLSLELSNDIKGFLAQNNRTKTHDAHMLAQKYSPLVLEEFWANNFGFISLFDFWNSLDSTVMANRILEIKTFYKRLKEKKIDILCTCSKCKHLRMTEKTLDI